MTDSSRLPGGQATARSTPAFRWGYIIFPLTVLLVSVIMVAVFSPHLPPEVAYHFSGNGSPDQWVSKGRLILVMLLPQIFFTALAAGVTWGMGILSVWLGATRQPRAKLERVILLMGSMFAMPQVVLAFAMLDIFAFNVFQVRLMPLWVFAVLVMGLGGIILSVFFVRTIREALRPTQ